MKTSIKLKQPFKRFYIINIVLNKIICKTTSNICIIKKIMIRYAYLDKKIIYMNISYIQI
jgi:hypothetical protein